jgi:hypothetical protein
MNSTLKTILKVTAAVVVPGAAIFMVGAWLLKDVEKEAFKKYIHKTYGDGSKYVDNYH